LKNLPFRKNQLNISVNESKFHNDTNESRKRRVMDSNLQKGIAYSICDFFENGDFNMVYVQSIPGWELKIREKFLELMEKANPKLSKDDLFRLKKEKKELKSRIKEEDKKRVDTMGKPATNFRLIKFMCNLRKSCVL
jgi:hypothetical protein